MEIEALQKEVARLTQLQSRPAVSTVHKVDPSVEKVFRDMGALVKSKEEEIVRLNATIESLVSQGTYDESAAFRVCSKMQSLVSENKRLGKMLGAGRAMQHEIELSILRVENEQLRKQLEQVRGEETG